MSLAAEDESLLSGVVGFGDAGLDHHARVAALVVLRLVGDGSDDITGGESEGGTECSEGGDEHRDDDFDDLLLFHGS